MQMERFAVKLAQSSDLVGNNYLLEFGHYWELYGESHVFGEALLHGFGGISLREEGGVGQVKLRWAKTATG